MTLLPAADPAEECGLAIGRVQSLIRGGARWRQIGVAYTDAAVYEPLLETLLDRYLVPAYFSGDRDLLRHGVIRAVVYALEAAACGMEAQSISEYLKSGFAPVPHAALFRYECSAWENLNVNDKLKVNMHIQPEHYQYRQLSFY